MRPKRRVNQIGKIVKIGRELRMTASIDDYDMDYIIMELGFDVNILTSKKWENDRKSETSVVSCPTND